MHLGLYNPVMPDDDYEKLEKLVTETITQRVSEEVESDLTGQVQGNQPAIVFADVGNGGIHMFVADQFRG